MTTVDLTNERILIVDDEPANVTILRRVLEQEGYRNLVPVTDPREVPGLLETAEPDLILLDLLMPHVDGYRILDLVAERWPDALRPPVLVLTADVTRQARENALRAGAIDFLTKPFDHLEVVLRIRNLLTRRILEVRLAEQNERLDELVAVRTAALRDSVERLRESARARQDLLNRLVAAQERERRMIALEVHDDAIQALVALKLRLERAERRAIDDAAREELTELTTTVDRTMGRLRRLVHELRAPELVTGGLEDALRRLLESSVGLTDQPLEVDLLVAVPVEVDPTTQTVIYRIAQEAITNARKHARAGHVGVAVIAESGGLALEVRDDGVGFEMSEFGAAEMNLGLTTMDERARAAGGWCRVESSTGSGTVVRAWVPWAIEPMAGLTEPSDERPG